MGAPGTTSTTIGRNPGLLRLGTIISYNPEKLLVQVYIGGLKEYNAIKQDTNNLIYAQLPVSHYSPLEEMFVGGYPDSGTPVVVGQADGGRWYIVTTLVKDVGSRTVTSSTPKIPSLKQGSYLIQKGNDFFEITENDISIGDITSKVTLDTARHIATDTFDNKYSFSEASRKVEGVVRRDVSPNSFFASTLREKAPEYDDTLRVIGFDPTVKTSYSNVGSSIRNPARTEQREVIYEFGRSYSVLGNDAEFLSYKDEVDSNVTGIIDRRRGRADALSLSLIEPNYLIETIKGTVVDLYGNMVDINRSIIPIGKTSKLSVASIKTNLQEQDPLGNVFENMKEAERREIAYHFELNAKKDVVGPPNTDSRDDYTRARSRFSVDINKEGLLKLNVPATSNTGTVPLLARYENYSTIFPNENSKHPNDLVFNTDYQDVLIESFIGDNGVVTIVDQQERDASPIDRFSDPGAPTYIKHGTVYHDISQTCYMFQDNVGTFYESIPTTTFATGGVADKSNIVSPRIIVDGKEANAGGRSASINLDGSIEFNVGANTVDRQSMWVDMQGGIIGNVGRDLNNVSAALQFDGELLIQSGGQTPSLDSRFPDDQVNNGSIPGAFDLRVITASGAVHAIRIDNSGVNIHSESRIVFYSHQDMMFRCMGTFTVDAEQMIVQNRVVRKDQGLGSI